MSFIIKYLRLNLTKDDQDILYTYKTLLRKIKEDKQKDTSC